MEKTIVTSPNFLASDSLDGDSLDYIMHVNELRGLIDGISVELGWPVAVTQNQVATSFRIDSAYSESFLHSTCKNIRTTNGTSFCHSIDRLIAEIMVGISVDDDIDTIQKKNSQENKHEVTWRPYSVNNRTLLEYTCPVTGFRGLAFPIFFENASIATLMIEQLRISDSSDDIMHMSISKIANELFSNQVDLSSYAIQKQNAFYTSAVNEDACLSEQNYQELIYRGCIACDWLEKVLITRMKEKRMRYIRDHIEKALSIFYSSWEEDVGEYENVPSTKLAIFWDAFAASFEHLNIAFGFKYTMILGNDQIRGDDADSLSVIRLIGLDNDYSKDYRFNINELKSDVLLRPTNSLRDETLLHALTPYNKTSNEILILYPSKEQKHYSIAILFGFPANIKCDGEVARQIADYLLISCNGMFTALMSLMARISETIISRILRAHRHELSHHILGLKHILDYRFGGVEKIRHLSDKDIAIAHDDAISYLDRITMLNGNIRMLFEDSSLDIDAPKYAMFFGDVLFKLVNVYGHWSRAKQLKISYPCVHSGDVRRGRFLMNVSLMDQVVNNLLDNAVKYSHWGTNIHIDCAVVGPYKEQRSLTITSFGYEMENDDSIYSLFSRGSVPDANGSGMGLFIAKKIVEYWGGTITHKSFWISDMNVGLLRGPLHAGFGWLNDSTIEKNAVAEIVRLRLLKYEPSQILGSEILRISENVYGDVINESANWKHPVARVRDSISTPTYKNTFEVTI